MKIKPVVDNIVKVKVDAIIVNHFEGLKHPVGDATTVDKALDGAVSQLIKQGEIKGKLNARAFRDIGLRYPGRLKLAGKWIK